MLALEDAESGDGGGSAFAYIAYPHQLGVLAGAEIKYNPRSGIKTQRSRYKPSRKVQSGFRTEGIITF